MKIKAIAPWFGGKRRLAPKIIEALGDHRAYWEPFCGSMAVLMAKPPCTMETVNDLHGDLINLAYVIRDPAKGPRLYRMLRRTMMTEDFFIESDQMVRAKSSCDQVGRAYHYFVTSWLGRNGVAGVVDSTMGTYCLRYTASGGHAATRWNSAIMSIPAWRRRLRNVTILRRDGFDLLERIGDDIGTAIYVDPPYLVKGAKYLHDFDSRRDHERLAEILQRFVRARVVVSYYDHPDLDELYPGWTRTEIVVSKSLSNSATKSGKPAHATEVLLTKGDKTLWE